MNKVLFGILFAWAFGITMWLFYPKDNPAIYVNLDKVYQDFGLTKELTVKFEEAKQAGQTVLDSLEVQVLKYEPSSVEYKKLSNLYVSRQNELANSFERMGQQYDLQIWKQINDYVNKYGAHYELEYIFGTRGDGHIMYGNKKQDQTTDVIKFINEKYEGH